MVTARPGGSATITLDGQNVDGSLRSPEVDRSVSFVSAIPEVREQLAAEQQRFAETGDVVMVGRDIGTVVLPDAEVKIYLTASAETRARRRHDEHIAASKVSRYDEVLSELRKRDRIDSGRQTSPLRPAEDAHILHTDDMTLEKVVNRMAETCRGGAMTGQWIFPIANVLFKSSMGDFCGLQGSRTGEHSDSRAAHRRAESLGKYRSGDRGVSPQQAAAVHGQERAFFESDDEIPACRLRGPSARQDGGGPAQH